jgi:hypothetical protein
VDTTLSWAATSRGPTHEDLVLGLTDLDGLADELIGHGVDVTIDVDVALEVNDALVQ